jgi:hypothetical protein
VSEPLSRPSQLFRFFRTLVRRPQKKIKEID